MILPANRGFQRMVADVFHKHVLAVAARMITLAGCAAMEKSDARDTERVLAAAGFQMEFADTPALQQEMKKLPQHKLAHPTRDGKLFFVYADNLSCRCLYIGSESAYQRYQRLALERNISLDESMTADMNWDAWGSWAPAY